MMLAACETRKEQIYYDGDIDAVQISATVGCVHAKSNPLGTDDLLKSFNFNDVICVQTPDLVAEYYKAGTGWKPTDRYYFRWNNDPVTFQAYYPVVGGAGYDKFAVRPNQYSLENLVSSDYMTGVAENVYREKVEIVMHRRMAKLSFKIAGVEEGMKVQAFKVGSYSVYEEGQPSGNTTISPYISTPDIAAGENGTVYTAVVIPGPAVSKSAFVTMSYKGANLKKTGIPAFEAGYSYEYTVTLSGSSMTLSEPVVSCWTEALASDNQPENPGGEPDEPDTPDNPDVPDNPDDPDPDNPDTPDNPEVPEGPSLEGSLFVTPEGAGDKSGKSWDNAMGMAEFRPLISSDYGAKSADECAELDGITFHFMEGSYCATTSEKDRLKIQFPNYGKACKITILGGYDSSSTGIDLTKRDITANVTEFTGDRNDNGKADSGDTGIFCIDAWCELTIDGCTFAHSYGKDRWKQKALLLNTDTSGALARVNVSNCIFHDLYDLDDSEAKYEGGAAIWLYNRSVATVHNCKFYDCHSTSRGGAIRAGSGSSVLFVNNCTIYDNDIKDSWGNGVQISDGTFCMNNSTIAKNDGKGAALNGGGNWLVVNSTIINAYVSGSEGSDMVVRNESKSANNAAVLMNSIVLFDGDNTAIHINGDDRQLTSKGHNVYGTVGGSTSNFITNAADKAGQTFAGFGLTWNNAGYYIWNGNVDGFTKATLSDIENVVKNDCNKTAEPFTNVGLEFYNWLQEVGGGRNPLACDQAGNARNTSEMWPGAYEKH